MAPGLQPAAARIPVVVAHVDEQGTIGGYGEVHYNNLSGKGGYGDLVLATASSSGCDDCIRRLVRLPVILWYTEHRLS